MGEETINSDTTPLTSDEEYDAVNGSGRYGIWDLNEIESDGDAVPEDDDISPVLSDQGSLIQRGLPAVAVANDNEIQTGHNGTGVSTRFSNLVSPLVQPVRNMCGRFLYRRRKKSIKKLAGTYCRYIISMVPKESVPRQAVMIFETILQCELPTHDDVGRASITHYKDSSTERTMAASKFSGEAVMKLCEFLEASLQMVDCITSVCDILDQSLNADCMIDIDTEEHKLCVLFVQRLDYLLKRFDALSTAATTTFQQFLRSSLLHGILSLPQIVTIENINARIFPSAVGIIEALCSRAIGAVIRFSAFTCSILCRQTVDNLETKIGNFANDITICIKEFNCPMNSSAEEYVNKKVSLSLQRQSPEPPVSKNFSREYKIFMQYEDILRAGNLLLEKLSTAKDLANELLNVERDSIDQSVDLAARIGVEQSEAYGISKSLNNLMEIQTLLVKQLKFKPQLESGTHTIPGDSIRREVQGPLHSETNIEAEEIPMNEYHSSGSEDSENDETRENKDEVFIAITSGEDTCETTEDFSKFDGDDKKLVKQSYSRLVTELKGSIEHIHQNTIRRENEAQTKIYGSAQIDLVGGCDSNESDAIEGLKKVKNEESCSLRSLSEQDLLVDEFDGLHTSKRVDFSKKRKSVGDKGSYYSRNAGAALEDELSFILDPNIKKSQQLGDVDDETTAATFYPVASIIGELNSKIKNRKPAPALGSTDCIGDESTSESDLSDQDE